MFWKPFLPPILVSLAALPAMGAQFKRGDSNLDGQFDVSDPVKTLRVLFQGDSFPGCDNAMDANDDGRVDIADGVYSLASLFTGGSTPPAPYPGCGNDPSPGSLVCASYPLCACLGQSEVDQAIAGAVPPVTCIPADAAKVTYLVFLITVCPSAAAAPCGDPPLPGCPVELTSVKGALDLGARRVVVHVEGKVESLPVFVEATGGSRATCLFDATFKGDVVIPFLALPDSQGRLKLIQILDPLTQNVLLEVAPAPGFLCASIAAQTSQFADQLSPQLLSAAAGLIADLRTRFVGSYLCQ